MIKKIIYKLFYKIFSWYFKYLKNAFNKAKVDYYQSYIERRALFKGNNIIINGEVFISDYKYLIIGNNVHIGSDCYFKTEGGLAIGDNVHFSRNVTIYTANHNYEGVALPYDNDYILKPVSIGKNVWIGMNVNITPGVTIGEGAIIGMGSVITKDVEAFSIVGNPPYRVLKNRNINHYNALLNNNSVGGINGMPLTKLQKENTAVSAQLLGKKMFFVLSTGRAGSESIAKNLNKHPDIICHHEPHHQLIRLSTEYAHGIKSRELVKEELKAIYVNCGVYDKHFIYGESDQKLSNLVEILAEILPEAKFVWLIRDAKKMVASGYSRGWFGEEFEPNYRSKVGFKIPRIFTKYRVNGALTGDVTQSEWEAMSAFEKNCWYWYYWNLIIEKQLLNIPKSRWIKIHLEKVNDEYPKLLEFLEASSFKIEITKTNKAQYKLKSDDSWDESMNDSFNKWCVKVKN